MTPAGLTTALARMLHVGLGKKRNADRVDQARRPRKIAGPQSMVDRFRPQLMLLTPRAGPLV